MPMFNNTNINLKQNTSNITFNTPCTGILQRSNPNSTFVRFAINSDIERWLFPSDDSKPMIKVYEYHQDGYRKYTNHGIEVIVLQILIFGNNQYLVEVIEPKFLTESN